MKQANLISIVNAYRNLDGPLFKSYIEHFKIKTKNEEIEDLESLLGRIYYLNTQIAIYEGYYLGYSIPQIGKEFDVLLPAQEKATCHRLSDIRHVLQG